MFSRDKFIELVKKANLIHWSAEKSSMTPLIQLLPAEGVLSKAQQMRIQETIWPVGDNPAWVQKKEKYKRALIYLAHEVLAMPERVAERVLLKKGEKKIGWTERALRADWEFTHVTTKLNLMALDPHSSREFCYPDGGMWYDWPANEFVFCLPKLNQKQHKQKNQATFGGQTLTFTIPGGTPYYANIDVANASGEIAFYYKLELTKPRVRAVRLT